MAVARFACLVGEDHSALDEACHVCLGYTDVDLAIRGRAIGLLAGDRRCDLPTGITSRRGGRRQSVAARGQRRGRPDSGGPPSGSLGCGRTPARSSGRSAAAVGVVGRWGSPGRCGCGRSWWC
jgi:hypothetical protein